MQPGQFIKCHATTCFNPRPAVRPGDADTPSYDPNTTLLFQSAPGREAGRCHHDQGDAWKTTTAATWCCGFNPRPAVRPGDASNAPMWYLSQLVSIRARP